MSRPLDGLSRRRASRPRITRLPLAPVTARVRTMLILVAVVFSLAAGRAMQIQAIDAHALAAEAADQMTVARTIPAFRGQLTDRNGEVLAFTEATVTVIADSEMIRTNGRFGEKMTPRDQTVAATAAPRVADLLAAHLGGDPADYLPKLTRAGSRYSIVAKQVSAVTYTELDRAMDAAGLIGLHRESAPTRRYPNGTLASNIIGFLNGEGKAAGGLELALDAALAGKPGRETFETSPNGKIPLGTSVLIPATNGIDYQLTLDAGLQWQVEQVLADRVRVSRAASGIAVVLNVKTGEVLAMANFPTFDSNDAGKSDLADLGNRAVIASFTPGSVQKVLTFAALVDAGLVTANDIITIPTRIRSGDHYITDAWSHPKLEILARGIIAKSSNIGTITVARRMDKERLHSYLSSFGLGRKTGIGLPGESAGILPGPDMPDYTRDGLAFGGSGIAVTAIQEAAAVAAIANGGIYNAPTILKSRTLGDGTVEELPRPEPRRVISAEASREVVSMMEAMVAHSTSQTLTVDGYRTGAKTGTSKKFDPTCGCFKGLVTSTIGVGPVEDPQILTYVVVEDPQRGAFGQAVAGPAYQDILSLALTRYGIDPSPSKSPKLPIFP